MRRALSPEQQHRSRCDRCGAPGSAVEISALVARTSAKLREEYPAAWLPPWRVHFVCADELACMRRQLRNRGIETSELHQRHYRRKRTARRLERARERAA